MTAMKMTRLWSCDRGAAAPLVGVCAIVLVGAVAVAVDIGRGQVAQSKLQSSLDAAGLAAGAMVGQNLSSDILKPEARKYLDANFLGQTIDATITDFELELSDDNSKVMLEARASLPTTFMRIFGRNTMSVAARSEITREMTGLEVAIAVDVTGSMNDPVGGGDSTTKITALRTAATDLVNILFGSNETVDDLWVGLVPFSQSVNIGTSRTSWLSDYDARAAETKCIGPNNHTNWVHTHSAGEPAMHYCPTNGPHVSTRTNPHTLVNDWMYSSTPGWYFQHSWGGCIVERWSTGRDVTDDPPSVEKWKTYFVPDTAYNGSNNWRGPTNSSGSANNGANLVNATNSANKYCPLQAITTLTNSKSTLQGAIDNLVNPVGGTHITVGAAWGWRLLSPDWRGLWGGDMDANDLPLEHDEPLSRKALVLMTDGQNTAYTSVYTAYEWLSNGALGTTSNTTTAEATLDAKTLQICSAMKERGVLIYTIVFGNDSSASAKDMMKSCASQTDYYFDSPSQAALQQAFRTIGDSLSKLRISK